MSLVGASSVLHQNGFVEAAEQKGRGVVLRMRELKCPPMREPGPIYSKVPPF